jgi:hypothetical protein
MIKQKNTKIKKFTFNGDGEIKCKACEGKIVKTMYPSVCSANCASALQDYNNIHFPPSFIISLLNKVPNMEERQKQLDDFIKRHHIDAEKAIKKFNEQVELVRRFGTSAIKRRPLLLS